jgi:ATP-dependent DNA helicase RecQ
VPTDPTLAQIREVVRRFWGYDTLRPLQAEAIGAGLDRRDSLVVLPTGSGKSLCYQVPPLVADRLDVVVSPLISLMKDQVDGLRAAGVPATALHSAMTRRQRQQAEAFARSGLCRLLYLAPERLFTPWFDNLSAQVSIGAFVIDEAHCISHWGHDFRPEYRRLAMLKERFPAASVHAFTATATGRVQQDIVAQLRLSDPVVLIGSFDRPNLVYRVQARQSLKEQLREVLARHEHEALILYCLSRTDTERLAAWLTEQGHRAVCYHAGLGDEDRRKAQEAFLNEEIDIIVATVAFGMGIDRSNVRCVVHAAMPRSIEHYQQEAGRAGRDGLEAECILFYSPADVLRWQSLQEKSAGEVHSPAMQRYLAASGELLQHMKQFAAPGRCRHRMLVEYFGQPYEAPNCGACDVCLGETEELEEGTTTAQMILSCVARTGERFGAAHIIEVLRGADADRIRSLGHDRLSTFGLMKGTPVKALTNIVFQLLDQGLLTRTGGTYPVLKLNEDSWRVLRGQQPVWLLPVKRKEVRRTKVERESWQDVDRALFERLRKLRAEIARERGVPPYVVFSDQTLREMARVRPRNEQAFRGISGVGEKKLADFGARFLAVLREPT